MTSWRPLDAAYGGLTAVVSDLDEPAFLRPTRCVGWSVGDLLFHLLLDAQRALVALATPTDAPADTDHVSYWRTEETGGESAGEHAWFVRRASVAYRKPASLVRH